MVNMYSMGMMNSMNSMNNGNVFKNYNDKFGCGRIDFTERPYVQPYPMATLPRAKEPLIQKTWLSRFIEKCFLS